MSVLLKNATEHWRFVSPLLRKPTTEADYDGLVASLDELLEIIGEDESHPLASLAGLMGGLIEAYDLERRVMPKASGIEVLRYLMQEHQLMQSELPGVGTQSVVSEVLSGKRQLNLRQVRWLAERFSVPVDVFF